MRLRAYKYTMYAYMRLYIVKVWGLGLRMYHTIYLRMYTQYTRIRTYIDTKFACMYANTFLHTV